MKTLQINNINFCAGNIYLKNINKENLATYDAIKKIALEKDADISIAQRKKAKNLNCENIYNVIASKNIPRDDKHALSGKVVHGDSFAIMSKHACAEESSVRIFNAVINALENLEKNLKI